MKITITERDKIVEEFGFEIKKEEYNLIKMDTYCPFCGEKNIYKLEKCSDFYSGSACFCYSCKTFSHEPYKHMFSDEKDYYKPEVLIN